MSTFPPDMLCDLLLDLVLEDMSHTDQEKMIEMLDLPIGRTLEQTENAKRDRAEKLMAMLPKG